MTVSRLKLHVELNRFLSAFSLNKKINDNTNLILLLIHLLFRFQKTAPSTGLTFKALVIISQRQQNRGTKEKRIALANLRTLSISALRRKTCLLIVRSIAGIG